MIKSICTGGAGFIGSHLVERLLKEGHKVIVIDDLSMGNMANLPESKKLQIYTASILDDITENLFRGVDYVYHLAAKTRPQVSILNPEETNEVNVVGTLRIIRYCVKYHIKKLVFVSSSSVYGEQKDFPEAEDAVPFPMSPYAVSKLIGEQYCKLYERLDGLQANYIRPFNVYGSRQSLKGSYSPAVPNFIDSLSKNESPKITGNGKQARDFTYVDDVVDLIYKASQTKVSGEAFNAGAGHTYSINDLFKTVAKLLDKDIKPTYIAKVIEPKTTLADISKGKRLLGWIPKYTLEEGLRLTIKEILG
jgi:nucleoside-diphosphate-sugar epimerase